MGVCQSANRSHSGDSSFTISIKKALLPKTEIKNAGRQEPEGEPANQRNHQDMAKIKELQMAT